MFGFRVTKSELAGLIDAGCIEKAIYSGRDKHRKGMYVLEHSPSSTGTALEYHVPEVNEVLSTAELKSWRETDDQLGIYARVDLGAHDILDILVKKDYTGLDLNVADHIDTFPNPKACALY